MTTKTIYTCTHCGTEIDVSVLVYNLEQRLAAAEAALQRLMDVQNGPPLIRDTCEWNEAMRDACLAVGNPKAAEYYAKAGGDA